MILLGEFTKPHGRFVRGDLSIFVLTHLTVSALPYGTDHELIWKNISSWKDADGMPIIKLLDDSLARGPGLITYTRNNLKSVAYIEEVKRDGADLYRWVKLLSIILKRRNNVFMRWPGDYSGPLFFFKKLLQ